MLWPPPVDLNKNPEWWNEFWSDEANNGFGKPSEGLLKWIPLATSNNQTAVDIASGNGRYAAELAVRGYTTTALELSNAGASRIRETANQLGLSLMVKVGDFLTLSEETHLFDVVLCSGLLEEIPLETYSTAIRGLHNWAAPGAIVINRYCLEIKGRGVFAENGYVPSLYKADSWHMLHVDEMSALKMSKGGFELRHGTIVARKAS